MALLTARRGTGDHPRANYFEKVRPFLRPIRPKKKRGARNGADSGQKIGAKTGGKRRDSHSVGFHSLREQPQPKGGASWVGTYTSESEKENARVKLVPVKATKTQRYALGSTKGREGGTRSLRNSRSCRKKTVGRKKVILRIPVPQRRTSQVRSLYPN